ncbi:MAG: ribonuclease HII [Peptococcaceae bacterium]|jgi:ribonuclease HII|nr:ribonuclease HII [Peptococcaceae bacterium]
MTGKRFFMNPAGLSVWEELLAPDTLVAGVDEAGRGPLAGPVVAAAVILPRGCCPVGLDDSKKVPASRRESLAALIPRVAVAWAIGVSPVEEIDRDNIHQAGFAAMRRAIASLTVAPGHLLVDGYRIPGALLAQTAILQGDGQCAAIAAASILAKVARDRMMREYHRLFPQYGFDRHKGYGTAEHLRALAAYGPCPWHRRSFAPVRAVLEAAATRLADSGGDA